MLCMNLKTYNNGSTLWEQIKETALFYTPNDHYIWSSGKQGNNQARTFTKNYMNGWMDRWMDGRRDGGRDGWTDAV